MEEARDAVAAATRRLEAAVERLAEAAARRVQPASPRPPEAAAIADLAARLEAAIAALRRLLAEER